MCIRDSDCTAHFIRTDLLTAGVLSNLRQVTEYAAKHESRFVKLLIQMCIRDRLTAEYGRIGGNLNQIARYLNEYGAPYNALSGEVRAAIARCV